jgi:hypothetical protein
VPELPLPSLPLEPLLELLELPELESPVVSAKVNEGKASESTRNKMRDGLCAADEIKAAYLF